MIITYLETIELSPLSLMNYFLAKGNLIRILKKMDFTNSPQECRTFEIDEFDLK
jgi:hypothetical protein